MNWYFVHSLWGSSPLSENDGQIQHPQSAGASSVQVHRHRTRWHQQVGMAGQPAQRLLLLLHGTLWPAQLLLRSWEREQSQSPLQPDGEDAPTVWTTGRQTRRCLDRSQVSCGCFFYRMFALVFFFVILDMQLDLPLNIFNVRLLWAFWSLKLALYDLASSEWTVQFYNSQYRTTSVYVVCSWTSENIVFCPLTPRNVLQTKKASWSKH